MATTKTAISLEKSLFRQVDELACELQISRSRLFVKAVEEFIQRHRNRQLLAALDAAYSDEPDRAEETMRTARQRKHREMVDGQW